MVKRGFILMESWACIELTHNVKANAVHFAIVFIFIVNAIIQLRVQKSRFCPRSPIPINGYFGLWISSIMRIKKPCGWKTNPHGKRFHSLYEHLLAHVERAIAFGVDETALSIKFHPGNTFI
jgi:hypothetical protein